MATLMSQVKGFTKSQGNAGSRGLKLLDTSIDHMFKHNDWTPLAWLLAQSEGADATRLKAIANKCVGGVTMKKDKEQPSGLRITLGDNAGPTEKMEVLGTLVESGESFRGDKVKQQILDIEKVEKSFDVEKYAKTISNKLAKEHVSVSDLLKAMSALA